MKKTKQLIQVFLIILVGSALSVISLYSIFYAYFKAIEHYPMITLSITIPLIIIFAIIGIIVVYRNGND